MKRNQLGMTLIELLIVVAVVGILAAIAYPSYQSYLVKGNRTAAQAYMQDIASKEQQYLLNARTYTTSLGDLGLATVPADVDKYYTVTINPATATAFTVTATPKTGTKQEGDGTLTLDQLGNRSPASKWIN